MHEETVPSWMLGRPSQQTSSTAVNMVHDRLSTVSNNSFELLLLYIKNNVTTNKYITILAKASDNAGHKRVKMVSVEEGSFNVTDEHSKDLWL